LREIFPTNLVLRRLWLWKNIYNQTVWYILHETLLFLTKNRVSLYGTASRRYIKNKINSKLLFHPLFLDYLTLEFQINKSLINEKIPFLIHHVYHILKSRIDANWTYVDLLSSIFRALNEGEKSKQRTLLLINSKRRTGGTSSTY